MWMPSRKAGQIPRVSTRLSLSVENDEADAGCDGRTCLARPNPQARNRDREIFIFSVQLTTSRIGNYTWLIHTLLKVLVTSQIHFCSVITHDTIITINTIITITTRQCYSL